MKAQLPKTVQRCVLISSDSPSIKFEMERIGREFLTSYVTAVLLPQLPAHYEKRHNGENSLMRVKFFMREGKSRFLDCVLPSASGWQDSARNDNVCGGRKSDAEWRLLRMSGGFRGADEVEEGLMDA